MHELEPQDNSLKQRRLPKLSDKQLIVLTLAVESLGIDFESHLFKQLRVTLTGQIDRRVFNSRHRPPLPLFRLKAASTAAVIIIILYISDSYMHDIHNLSHLKTQPHHCFLVGDKRYRGRHASTRLTCSTLPPSAWKRPCDETKPASSHSARC
ncbi:hypothetical protein MCAMS1_00769 [biofilm metagenome]